MSGFLRRGAEGSWLPGPAREIWREGAPAGLAGLSALNVLGALLAQIAADEETEAFPGEHLAALFPLSAWRGAAVPSPAGGRAIGIRSWYGSKDEC